ncbi:hypothetical protein BDD12DRAFT_876536 [Trichophaea hybrida]|nr:hypothetical protein BDD12DRAFT_876536 [Trichophaea hybrida]
MPLWTSPSIKPLIEKLSLTKRRKASTQPNDTIISTPSELAPPVEYMLQLPVELLLEIASHLPHSSVACLNRTNRCLHNVLRGPLRRRLFSDKTLRFKIPVHTYPYLDSPERTVISASVLQWAAFNNDTTLVEEILDTGLWKVDEACSPGVLPRSPASDVRTPLYLAVTLGHVDIVKVLLRRGAAVTGEAFARFTEAPITWVERWRVWWLLVEEMERRKCGIK